MLGKRFLAAAAIGLIGGGSAVAETWAVHGTIVAPDRVIEAGSVLIADERIEAVGRDVSVPAAARIVKLDDDIVLPGFVDLHNHVPWNVFPEWHPERTYANRYDWQASEVYDRLLSIPNGRLWATDHGCEANYFGEVLALIGGATSTTGSSIGPDGQGCDSVLVRLLDYTPRLPVPASSPDCPGTAPERVGLITHQTFPLQADYGALEWIRCALADGGLRGYLIHLAEGKPDDPDAAREYAMFVARGLNRAGVGVIQGTALTRHEFAAMQTDGVGLIWSPRSNDVLYGGTLDIGSALATGVAIAIGPDWGATGSGGMLQEIRYAAANFRDASAEQLVAMATSAPASIVRLDQWIGSLAPGKMADLVVIRGRGGDPYANVVTATPADVRLVVVGGVAVYGDAVLMTDQHPDDELDRIEVCGVDKALFRAKAADRPLPWDDVVADLQTELRQYGTHLAAIACD